MGFPFTASTLSLSHNYQDYSSVLSLVVDTCLLLRMEVSEWVPPAIQQRSGAEILMTGYTVRSFTFEFLQDFQANVMQSK